MPTRLSPPRLAPPSYTDRDLLRAYAEGGDPAAFAELARRHAGLARRAAAEVCPAAADDAAQAALVLLGRKAAAVAARGTASGWVFETARRLALKARTAAARRARHEARGAPLPPPADPLDALTLRELRAAVAEEVARLPDELREPLVLCYWDGQPREAAAARVGCSLSTLKRRLDEGRDRLAARLARRGFAGPAVLAALTAVEAGGRAAVPPAVLAAATGTEPLTAGAAGLLRSARWGAAGKLAAVVAAALATGAGLAVGFAPGGGPHSPTTPPKPVAEAKADGPPADAFGDPLPPDALSRMGSIRWRHVDGSPSNLHVAPSPTGQLVATVTSGQGEGEKRTVRVWNLADGRPVCGFPREDTLSGGDLQFTPDGSRLMFLGSRGVVRFHDPRTGKVLAESKPTVEKDDLRTSFGTHRYSATQHTLTKDGRWVVTSDDGKLTLSEVTTDPAATPHRVNLEAPPGRHSGKHYACDGTTLVFIDHGGADILRWDVRTGKLGRKTAIHARNNMVMASTPDRKRVATWRYDVPPHDVLRVWDTETGAEVVELEGAERRGYGDIGFSPDGNRLVAATRQTKETMTAVVWELDRGKVIARVGVPGWVDKLLLLPGGKTLLATTSDGLTKFATWDIATGRRLSPITGHESSVQHLAFTPDGKTLLTASTDPEERVTAWDAATGKKLQELAAPPVPRFWMGRSTPFVLTPGGAVVATEKGTLVWIDPKTGDELRRVTPEPITATMHPNDCFHSVRLSLTHDPRTGRSAVLGLHTFGPNPYGSGEPTHRWKGVVSLWDAGSGELLAHRMFSRRYGANGEVVSPDGRWLAGIAYDSSTGTQWVVLDSALGGLGSFELKHPNGPGLPSLFAPDGQTLITVVRKKRSPEKPGDRPVVTGTVRLWEVRTGKQRLEFPVPFEPSTFAFSPDGRFLAAERTDARTITVWDLATGAEVTRRSGYSSRVQTLAFRSDGKALASGHADGTALVWDLSGLPGVTLAAADRDAAWNDFASDDAGTAYRAVLALAADLGGAAFLRGRVKPVEPAPADRVRRLVADLDSPEFATRERATAGLTKLGDSADDQLRAALKGDLSAEQRRRVEDVLGGRRLTESDPGRLRALRCVEALERSGSADAQAALAELAKGEAGARLTRDAAGALRRLAGR